MDDTASFYEALAELQDIERKAFSIQDKLPGLVELRFEHAAQLLIVREKWGKLPISERENLHPWHHLTF